MSEGRRVDLARTLTEHDEQDRDAPGAHDPRNYLATLMMVAEFDAARTRPSPAGSSPTDPGEAPITKGGSDA